MVGLVGESLLGYYLISLSFRGKSPQGAVDCNSPRTTASALALPSTPLQVRKTLLGKFVLVCLEGSVFCFLFFLHPVG